MTYSQFLLIFISESIEPQICPSCGGSGMVAHAIPEKFEPCLKCLTNVIECEVSCFFFLSNSFGMIKVVGTLDLTISNL